MNATATSAPERILFVSYWTAGEPLIASMVLPYLRLLAARADVAHITLVTLASDPRQPNDGVLPPLPKVTHRPIPARRGLPHVPRPNSPCARHVPWRGSPAMRAAASSSPPPPWQGHRP
jgi:hypothetical protein